MIGSVTISLLLPAWAVKNYLRNHLERRIFCDEAKNDSVKEGILRSN